MNAILKKQWQLAPPATAIQRARLGNLPPILAQLCLNRNLRTPEELQLYLNADEFPDHPEDLLGVPEAVRRIFDALESGERIAVYGDYDADGVTATALMMQTLRALGADALAYIPHRVNEGYGLNIAALRRLAEEGATLFITVDCGIRNLAAARWLRDSGHSLIITDHHTLAAKLPEAVAVINPRQQGCAFPAKELAGVGVAFYLAYALLREKQRRDGRANFPDIRLSDLLDLVAIGTVADLMPLNDPHNRALVKAGLEVIREGRRLGLRVLMNVANIPLAEIDAGKIGHRLAPRINAAGRLDDAILAYQLLLSDDEGEAFQLAEKLVALNQRRQTLTSQSLEQVRSRIAEQDLEKRPLICAGDEGFLHGIVGLVAGRVCEEFYRPAVIWERGERFSHASCRSIPNFDIVAALDECADLLEKHGGHAAAAGFTVRNEHLKALCARLQNLALNQLRGKTLTPTLLLDAEINTAEIQPQLLDELAKLEPTGYGNPKALFLIRNLRVIRKRAVGQEAAHLSLQFANPAGKPLRGIAFYRGDQRHELPARIDIATHIEENWWNGRRMIDLNIQDWQAAP